MSIYENFLRPCLFAMEPEMVHSLAVSLLERTGRSAVLRDALARRFTFSHPSLETRVAGIRFPNPIGLAAGFDKDCRLAQALPSLGFGFLELGTLTPLPQAGNPRPRIFRAPEARALINRLGFNNEGAEAAAQRLRSLAFRAGPIGINIGKGMDTPLEKATEDYCRAFSTLAPYADYVVINVSSPNTPGLRDLQGRKQLEDILVALREKGGANTPIFVKLSPDLSLDQLDSICPLLMDRADGAVVSNTTLSRNKIPAVYAANIGGVSGAPLKELSTRLISEVYRRTQGKLSIIGVGGIFNAEDAFEKILAGASLIQIYTGFIYRGPGVVREILEGLVRILSERGLHSISEAVGLDHRAPAAARNQ